MFLFKEALPLYPEGNPPPLPSSSLTPPSCLFPLPFGVGEGKGKVAHPFGFLEEGWGRDSNYWRRVRGEEGWGNFPQPKYAATPLTPPSKLPPLPKATWRGKGCCFGKGRVIGGRGEERNLICKKHIRHQNSYLMIRILWAVLAWLHNYIDRYFLFNQKKLINETTKIL